MEVLFEDSAILVVNKPSGVLVHPVEESLAHSSKAEETCLTMARRHCRQRVYPVHRLDRPTSGVLIFAKSSQMASELCRQFEEGEVVKHYLALVRGWMLSSCEVVHPVWNEIRTRRLEASTLFVPKERFEVVAPIGPHNTVRYCLLEACPRTGRFHQIRQHLKHLSRPVIGDTVHGDGVHNRFFRDNFSLHRLFLHSTSLNFFHPETRTPMAVEAPLPLELVMVVEKLRQTSVVCGLE